jgi:phosphatidylglycerophosphate synthase
MPLKIIGGRRNLPAHGEIMHAPSLTTIQIEHVRMRRKRDLSKHQRVNDILLGPLERPALKWLAVHMPTWVTPDLCTATGVIGALAIMISYALSRIDPTFLWLASLGFVINWFGDSLDGTLARYRQIERPLYGFFIDHTADAFNETMIMLGLGLTPYVRFDLTCLALSVYLLFSIFAFVRIYTFGEFKISYWKVGPTEVRVLAILFNTAMYFGGLRVISVSYGATGQITFSPYDLVLVAIVLIMLSSFVVIVIQESIKLAKTNGLACRKRDAHHRGTE